MDARHGARGGLVSVVLAIVAVACGSTPPSASIESPGVQAPAGEPASATNQADGLLVTLAISSDRVAAGDRIRLRVSALNAGLGPVTYMAGGCGPIGTISIDGPPVNVAAAGEPPRGTSGADVLALARWSALSQAGDGIDWIRTPGIPDDAAMGCDASLRYEDIDPGATFIDEAVWIARTVDGQPAPGGAYTFRLEFPFVGRVATDDVGPDPVVTPIPVVLPLTVEGGPGAAVDAVTAIEAAMANPALLEWADRSLTRERLTGATVSFVDGAWRWQIRYQGGQTEVIVDATTGEVIDTRLGP